MIDTVQEVFGSQLDSNNRVLGDDPIVLKGWANEWKATQKWSLEYFSENFGHIPVRISNYKKDQYASPQQKPIASIAQYVAAARGQLENEYLGQDSYLAGWHFQKDAPELMNDIEIPKLFQNNLLDKISTEVINYDSWSLFIGHQNVESPLHTDSFAVSVWLANIVGEKKVRLVPPWNYSVVKNGMDMFSQSNVERVVASGLPVFDTTLKAGDILFIPPGYWHQVKNLGFTIAVSVNFVGPYHFVPFEQQLRSKVIAPYLKLLAFKKNFITQNSEAELSVQSLKNFKVVENETRFLDFLERQLQNERVFLEKLKKDLSCDSQSTVDL
jgi:hypothetical protein